MDLEELRSAWEEMSSKLEAQKSVTDDIILKMTKENYKNNLNKISRPESYGAIIALFGALAILFNFYQLDTWLLRVCGSISLIIMIVLPLLSLIYLRRMQHIDVSENNYKDVVQKFSKNKQRFQRLQKTSVYIGFVFMIILIPVTSKLMNGEDIFSQPFKPFWFWFLPLAFIFYYLFSKKVLKCYTSNINRANRLLNDLER
ncbi:hypothetical protein SAMN04487911_10961 [Arenibacter nanhaiticus]|uniref:Uncharacterized protein n=1 Tax=Arenibacter nanhaiticus TaxID=558155 RepID=A0A1M6FRS0_9FLAO|nr:hypothetical protein [Arenibacter nanhaiticus]SHJ00395.1 hypothetical protein SAMN04487911_10961 [Arenibacter nanhaiticus]